MASGISTVALPASASGQVGTQNPNAHLTYYGFSVRETSGTAAAVIRVRDGGVVTGHIIDTIALTAGESAREFYHGGINVGSGLYVELVSGTMPEGTLRVM